MRSSSPLHRNPAPGQPGSLSGTAQEFGRQVAGQLTPANQVRTARKHNKSATWVLGILMRQRPPVVTPLPLPCLLRFCTAFCMSTSCMAL